MTTFHTSEKALDRRYKAVGRQMAFQAASPRQARAWQRKARARLIDLLGLPNFEPAPLKARKVEDVEADGVRRETWLLQTEREVWMPFHLLLPLEREEPAPLVVCPHGHASAGKWAPAGRRDIPGMPKIIDQFNYDYGLQLARAGFITACSDARGFGERREPDKQQPDSQFVSSCHNLTLAGVPLGLTVQGMWTWDLMRLLDFLTQDKRIDSARIGCAGLSGGGLQTLNLAALDERIQAAVVSGYFYGVRESLMILNGNCMCNMVPHLWENFDMGDIAALIAPRGLFIETGDADSLNGKSNLKNVRSQVSVARGAYAALEAKGNLEHHVFQGEHRWCGERAIPWLQKRLQNS